MMEGAGLSEWRAVLKGIWWLFLECIPEKKLWVLRSVESCKQGDVTHNSVRYRNRGRKVNVSGVAAKEKHSLVVSAWPPG